MDQEESRRQTWWSALALGLRNWIPEPAIVGDAKVVLEDLTAAVGNRSARKSAWVEELQKAKAGYEEEVKSLSKHVSKPLKTFVVLKQMRKVFPRNTILCHEHGFLDT